MDVLGHAELRKGPAPTDRAYRPSRRSGAVPRDPRRGPRLSPMATTDIERSAGQGVGARAGDAIASEVLDLVRRRSDSAEAEVTVRTGVSALTRFASSFIHQNVAEEVSHVLLRVAL